jgi:hypothetical protein
MKEMEEWTGGEGTVLMWREMNDHRTDRRDGKAIRETGRK